MQELLIRGKNAFLEICKQIDNAKETIEIQMFIWRDDYIGNVLLNHLIKAAKRGIKIIIKKDAYGAMFEKGEENRQSLFHKKTNIKMTFLSWAISKIYYHKESPKNMKQIFNKNLITFLSFENVVYTTKIEKNHTKYYIFDNEILIIGGINVEDKENDRDFQNRIYEDYMLKITDLKKVKLLKDRLFNNENFDSKNNFDFIVNNKKSKISLNVFLNLINNSKKHIYMIMAYFGNKDITKAIIAAKKRGVKITIISSKVSNVQPEQNIQVLKKLYDNNINVYLYKGLIHAKTMLIDDALIIGSTNLNNSSLKRLSEAAVYTKDSKTIEKYLKEVERIKSDSIKSNNIELRYKHFKAFIESLAS